MFTMRKATLFNIRMSFLKIASIFLLVSSFGISAHAQNDCPPLTVFCQDLHTSFMPDACMVEVWAKDFISKINNPETDLNDFIISFEEDSEVMSRAFQSMFGDSYEVTIWVTSRCDPSLQTRCVVTLDINDNTGDCPTPECPINVNPWCGYAVVTCSAGIPNDNTAAIIDLRENSTAPRGDDWLNPRTPGVDGVPFLRPDAWALENIGMVYGIELKPQTGEIFLAASDIYAFDFQQFVSVGFPPPSCSGPAGPAGIYKSQFNTDPTLITATPIIFTDTINYLEENQVIGGNIIPNSGNTRECDVVTIEELLDRPRTGNGLGNIAYDRFSNHLFVTNLEDGKIYSINSATNTITDVFDPFDAYDHAVDGDGLVDSLNRIWGIQTLTCERPAKVFFARQNEDGNVDNLTNRPKEIWSIQVDDNGRFIGNDGDENLEVTIALGRQLKITDIAFNAMCNRMLVAERGDDHKSRIFEYTLNGSGDWIFNQRIHVGIFDDDAPAQEDGIIRGTSAAGGVSYGAGEFGGVVDSSCDSIIWGTTNCGDLAADPGRCDIYGLQGVSRNGNVVETNSMTDIYIDFDPGFTNDPLNFKSNIGEVEVFNCCCINDEGRNVINTTTSAIGGSVASSFQERLERVNVNISSETMNQTIRTNEEGRFELANLEANKDYMIRPTFSDDIMNGLSTLDLVLIQRHILGLNSFEAADQYIAADINASGSITALDLVELRRIILGQQESFKNNRVWNFVANMPSVDELKSNIAYDSYHNVTNLSSDFMYADFTGVKTGDINGDSQLSLGRSNDRIKLTYRVVENEDGLDKIEFFVSERVELTGFQFSLSGLGTEALTSGYLKLSESNYATNGSDMLVSWNSSNSVQLDPNTVLFSMLLDSKSTGDLNFGSTLSPEIYDSELKKYDLQIVEQKVGEGLDILGVFPNPSTGVFNLEFIIEESQEYEVEVIAHNGVIARKTKHYGNKGVEKLSMSSTNVSELNTGIYVVRVKLKEKTLTEKLIIVD